jgi:hypothetical protein
MKEQADILPLVEAYLEYKKSNETIEESLMMLEEESDDDMREMLKEELNDAKKRVEELEEKCLQLIENHYRQVNGISADKEHIILISKKRKCNYKVKKIADDKVKIATKENSHNRKKNYILQEGMHIEPLIDMGIFTKDGKVVNSMYDKYKQINRFIEIIDDEISGQNIQELNVIDFGCGKSYLTFVVYYYLTEVRNI